MLDFATFSLSKCNTSCKKNCFKFGTKFVLFGYFSAETRKNYFTTLLYTLQSQNSSKIKLLRFEVKISLIGYFGLEFLKTNVVFEIGILEFVSKQRFIQKQKIFKLGTKTTLFRYFWAAI